MANFYGNSLANVITGTTGNDVIYGRGGNDTLNGNGGVDRIFGDGGNDFLYSFGGTARGGAGNDEVGGGGVLMGDGGRDIIVLLDKGAGYGGTGHDRLWAPLDIPGNGEQRNLTGGGGGDEFRVKLSPLDGIAVRVEIKDFQPSQGDKLLIYQTDPNGNSIVTAAQTFDAFDRNHDRVLSAEDGGLVHADPDGLALESTDGDAMVLVGRSVVFASDFLLG